MLDFTRFAALEWYHTVESERATERHEMCWLRSWRRLVRAEARAEEPAA